MSEQPTCTIKIRAGRDHAQRAIAFLEYDQIGYVDIREGFIELSDDEKRHFNTSFDYWISGIDNRPNRYHGWDLSEYGGKYQECFVFKNPPHRLYGFLCHPKEPEDKRFWMCVLILHAEKRRWKTDANELSRAEEMRQNVDVQDALKRIDWAEEIEQL